MSKKQDSFYFKNFVDCADCACRAAHLLDIIMSDFTPDNMQEKLDKMHAIEHEADVKKHEVLDALVKAFITPIEREDIIQMSQNIDEVTDKIEDVLIRTYYNRITRIQPDALAMIKVVIKCCEEMLELLRDFENFKSSKTLHDRIVLINSLEEEADQLFISSMYNLHGSGDDILNIVAWREIYLNLEQCADAIEHVADVVESAVMKNS